MQLQIKLSLLLFTTVLTTNILAQTDTTEINNNTWEPKTIFNLSEIKHGGYGALTLKYGTIDNSNTTFIGGRGGWIINHKIAFGFGGYGLFSESKTIIADIKYNYTGAYGGFIIEPIFFSNKIVHFSAPIMLGGGWVGRIQKINNNYELMYQDLIFMVVEPGLELDFNITNNFRIALGAYYTIANDIDGESELGDEIMNNLSIGLQFKWGLF